MREMQREDSHIFEETVLISIELYKRGKELMISIYNRLRQKWQY